VNTYNHHLGDYAKDTKNLSPLEHGCYRLLLDYNYATEKPIPIDVGELYRIVGAMTPAERKAVSKIAERFFPVNGDGRRHNKRAEEEIKKYIDRVEHNRSVGQLGGRPRKPGENPDGLPTGSVRVPFEKPVENPNQEPLAIDSNTSTANAVEARSVAAVPACPHEKLIALYHELLPMCPKVARWTAARQQALRARWRDEAQSGREKHKGYRTEAEGLANWRKFFAYVAQSPFLTGQASGRDGNPPFVASLSWLTKAENFAKVIEGTYHR
jgi:uncharacterized protein YdaU (DUF1376 family)